MDNPFEVIARRLTTVEELLLDLKHKPVTVQPTTQADELLTPEETANLLKVSKVTVWDWTKRGILKKHSIANQVRYLRSEVLEAVVKKSITSTAKAS